MILNDQWSKFKNTPRHWQNDYLCVGRNNRFIIKMPRTVSLVSIIQPFYSHLFAIVKLTFTRASVTCVIITYFSQLFSTDAWSRVTSITAFNYFLCY